MVLQSADHYDGGIADPRVVADVARDHVGLTGSAANEGGDAKEKEGGVEAHRRIPHPLVVRECAPGRLWGGVHGAARGPWL